MVEDSIYAAPVDSKNTPTIMNARLEADIICSRSYAGGERRKVVIIQEHLTHYRHSFFTRLRELLSQHLIDLVLIHGPTTDNRFLHHGLNWATEVRIIRLGSFSLHAAFARCWKADLLIAIQEVKYPLPLLFQLLAPFRRVRFAYWGHGRNFQSAKPNSPAERLKRSLACKVDWWFAYNDLSARVVASYGFPAERITSVGNAVDTTGMKRRLLELSPAEIDEARATHGIHSENVAVYTGGLYPNKRIDFLIEAARSIRRAIADFELVVIGDGPESFKVKEAAEAEKWIHFLGSKNDSDKVPYWAVAKLLLMPGLVGLVVVDSFALGVPIVTTDYPFHSPEIDYLKDGENGCIVPCGEDVGIYAEAVVQLLQDPDRIASLKQGAIRSSELHSIENMAANFADGVLRCLAK